MDQHQAMYGLKSWTLTVPTSMKIQISSKQGGDSVEALRLVAAAEAMDLALDIEDLFNYPTLGALATNCQEAGHVSKPKTQLAKYPSLIKTLCVHAQLPARSHVTRSRTFIQLQCSRWSTLRKNYNMAPILCSGFSKSVARWIATY